MAESHISAQMTLVTSSDTGCRHGEHLSLTPSTLPRIWAGLGFTAAKYSGWSCWTTASCQSVKRFCCASVGKNTNTGQSPHSLSSHLEAPSPYTSLICPKRLGLHSFYPDTHCWSNSRSFHHNWQNPPRLSVFYRALGPAFGLGQGKQSRGSRRSLRTESSENSTMLGTRTHLPHSYTSWFCCLQNMLIQTALQVNHTPYLVIQYHVKDSKPLYPRKMLKQLPRARPKGQEHWLCCPTAPAPPDPSHAKEQPQPISFLTFPSASK